MKARAPPVTNKSGSSMKQSQLTVADDGALKVCCTCHCVFVVLMQLYNVLNKLWPINSDNFS